MGGKIKGLGLGLGLGVQEIPVSTSPAHCPDSQGVWDQDAGL
jgi:hypothetical protein